MVFLSNVARLPLPLKQNRIFSKRKQKNVQIKMMNLNKIFRNLCGTHSSMCFDHIHLLFVSFSLTKNFDFFFKMFFFFFWFCLFQLKASNQNAYKFYLTISFCRAYIIPFQNSLDKSTLETINRYLLNPL